MIISDQEHFTYVTDIYLIISHVDNELVRCCDWNTDKLCIVFTIISATEGDGQ
jgi:hypothetical protein